MITLSWLDQVTAKLKYLSIYAIFIGVFAGAGIEKLTQSTPPSVIKEFSASWVATFPGTDLSWKLAGTGQVIVVLLMILSLVTLEWLPDKSKHVLRLALGLSMLVFAILAVGQYVGGVFSSAAELFMYWGAALVAWLVVRKDEQDRLDA